MSYLNRRGAYLAYLQDKIDNLPAPTTQEEKLLHDLCLHDDKEDAPPFWIEEKRTLVAEGIWNMLHENNIPLVAWKEYTVVIDGVKYVEKCISESAELFIAIPCPDGKAGWSCMIDEDYVKLNDDYYDMGEYHKVEFVEEVYHTIHDFMVIINARESEDNFSCDGKLVSGDFATAKEKALNGLPVTIYVCSTYCDEEWNETSNYVENSAYFISADGTEEYFNIANFWNITINPDGTIRAD